MNSKPTFLAFIRTFTLFLILLVLPSTNMLFAQTILPQKLGYPRICANIPNFEYPNGYNRYEVSFKLSGFAATESFIVLLSDENGNFTTPIKPKLIPNSSSTPADTPTDKTLTFEVPADLIGSDIYKIKVESGSGVRSADFKASDLQSSFPIHFLSYSGPFYINNQSNSLSFCFGGSVTLAIDNATPSVPKTSPLQYPQLKYKWYKDGNVIPNESNSTLSVDQPGDYYVEIDYGPCTDANTHSQIVKVGGASGSEASITSTSGNPFCSSLGNTTLSVTGGNSYVWRRDNVIIDDAISQTYQTNIPGIYTCDVDFGGCKSTATLDLKVFATNSTIAGADVDNINYIAEGETLNAIINSDATSPSYQWYLNDVAIPGADKNFLDITAPGKYKGTITQSAGCIVTDEFSFDVSLKENYNVPKISNIVTPNGDGVNDTWIVPDKYTIGTNTHIMILSSLGEIVYQSDSYDNYNGWPQTAIEFNNFNPVYYYIITPNGESAKKGSITLVK
jgi:gliding motility-associated-like protein